MPFPRPILSAVALHLAQASGQFTPRDWNTSTAAATCALFFQTHPDVTFLPNTTEYISLNEDYYSAAAWLSPACIVAPRTTSEMGTAVQALVQSGVEFAVRGGGHMPIAGAANINSSGILMSSSGLSQLQLSDDGSTVSVGPGNRWGNVYDYLEPYGLSVVGGRMGVVGVPGFLLGGGISFFGNEYGWASANVASYTCVLSDGTVVNATKTNEYSDLFWALRGGGNSFAIVAGFELNTVPAPAVTVGQASYGTGLRDEYLDSVFGFAFDGVLDRKAAVIPMATWTAATGDAPIYQSYIFYNGNMTAPAALANFTGPDALLKANTSTFSYRSTANWSNETGMGFSRTHGMHFRFHLVSIVADRQAMGIIRDVFLDTARQRLANVSNALATLVMMPISESFITANRGEDPAGDPMGIDAAKAPYVWVEQTIMFSDAADNDVVTAFLTEANGEIVDRIGPLDVLSPYLYLNDVDKGQQVFEGYAPENVGRLKEIRSKYDPTGVYTYQMPGGFKVLAA